MKILIPTLIVLVLSSAALAEDPTGSSALPAPTRTDLLDTGGHAMLQLSPMVIEIKEVLERADREEAALLKALAAATTDEQAQSLIRRIERLAVDRELEVLRIQARYARLDRRFDLERRLKERMVEILTVCGDGTAAVHSVQAAR